MTVVLYHKEDNPHHGQNRRHPSFATRIQVSESTCITQDKEGEWQDDEVLHEGLHRRQANRIAEATAV